MRKGILCLSLILLCVLCLSVPVSATITGTTVTNTNIYGTSNIYQISPDDGTAPSISISGQYLYYTGISAVPTLAKTSDTTVTFSLANQRGAAVLADTTGTKSGMLISTASGVTADYLYDTTYNTQGVQTVTITSASNPSQTVSTTATTTVNVYFAPDVSSTSISINPSSPKGGISQSITLSLTNAPTVPTGDTYKYLYFIDNSKIDYSSTNYVKSFDITKPAGTYELKCKVVSSKSGLASYVYSNITFYAPPITNTTVTNTNIYGTSSVYDVAPESSIGAGVTTSGITHVAGQYVTFSNLTITPSSLDVGQPATVTWSWSGRKGAAVLADTTGTKSGIVYNYGTGAVVEANNTVHYTIAGTMNPILTMSNPSGSFSLRTNMTVTGPTIISGPTVNKTVVTLPGGAVRLSVTASHATTYAWYDNGQLIGSTSQITVPISVAGAHQYYVVVGNQYGYTTQSNTVTVQAGYKPSITILSPKSGANIIPNVRYTAKVNPGGTGSSTLTWSSPGAQFSGSGQEVFFQYPNSSGSGDRTITVSATNSFGSDTKTVTIHILDSTGGREKATGSLTAPDTSLYNETLSYATSFNGSIDNLENLRQTFEKPFTDIFGSALFYIIIFGVPAVLIWLATGSAKIPAIIGIILSGFIIVMFPEAWGANIFILIVTIVSTGIIWIFVHRER